MNTVSIYYEDDNKIKVEVFDNGAKLRTSINGKKIKNKTTNALYDSAYDVLEFEYEESDVPIETEGIKD